MGKTMEIDFESSITACHFSVPGEGIVCIMMGMKNVTDPVKLTKLLLEKWGNLHHFLWNMDQAPTTLARNKLKQLVKKPNTMNSINFVKENSQLIQG